MNISGVNTVVRIGDYETARCPEVVLSSRRDHPVSRAMVALADAAGDLRRGVAVGDAVVVEAGPRGGATALWRGTVTAVDAGEDTTYFRCAGPDLALAETRVCQSFLNETPEAIVKWAVSQAGLAAGRIDAPGVVFPRFVAADVPVWQVARQCEHTCNKAFAMGMNAWSLWMGADGKVNWGDFDEPGAVPVIATGAGLISHVPRVSDIVPARLSIVETFLMPGLTHSRRFRLTDTRSGVDGLFRAEWVVHRLSGESDRTFIGYGAPSEKF